MQNETRFKIAVRNRLEMIPGLWCEKIQQVCIRGTPDFLGCYKGRMFAWELKVGKNKADKLQLFKLDCIKQAGGIARIVTPETLEEAIEELLNAK